MKEGKSREKNIKTGEKVGWIGSFILFSIILYFVLVILKKISQSWGSYFSILIISALIVTIGFYLRKIIK